MNFVDILLVASVVFCTYLLIRALIAYNYAMYWIYVIRDYRLYCIEIDIAPLVDFDDVGDLKDYMWDVYTFNKDKMIKNKVKLRILKEYIRQTA